MHEERKQLDDALPIQYNQHGLVHYVGCYHAHWSLQVERQTLGLLHSVLLLLSKCGSYHRNRRDEIQHQRVPLSHQLDRYYTNGYSRRLQSVD